MIKHQILASLLLILAVIVSSCSSSQETTKKENEDDLYVFDEVPTENTFNIYDPQLDAGYTGQKYFIVQIGAFTTRDKAESFAATSKNKIPNEIEISYSNRVNLFVVHLKPFFTEKKEADNLRNEIWKLEDYKDAWVLTVIR